MQNDELVFTPQDENKEPERVNLSEFPVKRSIDCEHCYKEDHSDETEYYIAVVCKDCGFGYLRKKVEPNSHSPHNSRIDD